MREIGVIDWFGGYNKKTKTVNNYGFIITLSDESIYFHQNNVLAPIEEIEHKASRTVPVSYDIYKNRKGKLEAINVCLLCDEKDRETLALASRTKKFGIWKSVFKSFINELRPDEKIPIILDIMDKTKCKDDIISLLPEGLIYENVKIRQELSLPKRLEICCQMINKTSNTDWINELVETFLNLPDDIKPKVWSKISVNLYTFPSIINLLKSYLSAVPRSIRDKIINDLPLDVKKQQNIIKYAVPIDKVQTLWDRIQNFKDWNELDWQSKILLIYRLAYEKNYPNYLSIALENEQNKIVKSLIFLFLFSQSKYKHTSLLDGNAFIALHESITNLVNISIEQTGSDSIDLFPLLPECRCKIAKYCEGRSWSPKFKPDVHTYCAKLHSDCPNSIIKANPGLYWYQWTLLEFFDSLSIKPFGLSKYGLNDNMSSEYVNRLCGWVNRIIETSGKIKYNNLILSKNLAEY